MKTLDREVFFGSLVELHERLARREFTVEELWKGYAERLERRGPGLNALVLMLKGEAGKVAWGAEKEFQRGRTKSPLQGVPFGIKDLFSVARKPTAWGAPMFAGQVFEEDAGVVARLKKAGGLPLAKLATVALAGGTGYRMAGASVSGPGLNPWDKTRWAGGSSSGSAAAVAAGLVPYALGTETSGSILTPAAYCGVTGLRPTYGLVGRSGVMTLSWTLDKVGVLGRTAEDCGHVLAAMAGGDEQDLGSAGKGFRFAPQFAAKPEALKVGYAPTDWTTWPEAGLREPLEKALSVLRSTGAVTVTAELPPLPYGATLSVILGSEAATVFGDLMATGKIEELNDKRQVAGLKAAMRIRATEYLQAMRVRTRVQEEWGRLLGQVDLVVVPTRNGVAPLVSEPLGGGRGPGGTTPASAGFRAHIAASNLAGLPALTLPAGFANGLPVGITLIGKPFAENTLIRLGMEYQAKSEYHRQRPAE